MNITSFKNYLAEAESIAYFTFGRMNPPTIGHEKLLEALKAKAGNNPYFVYLSQSTDNKKNPLTYQQKVKHARKMFPKHARKILVSKNVKTPIDALTEVYNKGYKNAVMVVGSDRVREFDILLNKYNGVKGRHGFYNFESIKIVSAGERDPDSDDVSGMSASKQRERAAENDFAGFSQGVPKGMNTRDAKNLYNDVRKGMGLSEETVFKRHVELEPVSETREQYVKGNLFDLGDSIIIKESGEVAEISWLGTNYVVLQLENKTVRKWLTDIEKLDEDKTKVAQDPDIAQRKGSQPKKYHKGLSKSTKAARDRQFKKQTKMSDSDPNAYKPAPGDKTAKTKPSKYTKAFKDIYGEQVDPIDRAKERIKREKDLDKAKHDKMMDRARLKSARQKNRETDGNL